MVERKYGTEPTKDQEGEDSDPRDRKEKEKEDEEEKRCRAAYRDDLEKLEADSKAELAKIDTTDLLAKIQHAFKVHVTRSKIVSDEALRCRSKGHHEYYNFLQERTKE